MLVPWTKKTAEGMTTHSLTYEGTVRRGPFASLEPDHLSACWHLWPLSVRKFGIAALCHRACGPPEDRDGGQWYLKEKAFPVSSRALRHPRARLVHTALAFSESILWASSLCCLLKTQAHWSVHPKGPQVGCDRCIF